jgi:hypothetical protein
VAKRKSHAQLDREIAEALNAPAPPTITNRDQISDRTLNALGAELDEAAVRAARAGAKGGLEYQGAGATGIVFCDDRGNAFKVARRGREDSVAEEAEWLTKAAQVPGAREHVARNTRYDKKHDVLVRECVRGMTGTPRQTSKLFDIHKDIRAAMGPYGWLSPEFKEDSYVMARGSVKRKPGSSLIASRARSEDIRVPSTLLTNSGTVLCAIKSLQPSATSLRS